jgi:Transglutaminase-like superfamily
MTTPVIPESAGRLSLRKQVGPRCAVGVARLLVMLPPARLQRVLRWISQGAHPAGYADALRARQCAVAVSTRCAGLGCLQRSVATVLMCRARGKWADWCTGFRVEPFAAHAWVEAGGRPVGEPFDMSTFLTVLAVRAGGSSPAGTARTAPIASTVRSPGGSGGGLS